MAVAARAMTDRAAGSGTWAKAWAKSASKSAAKDPAAGSDWV
jgi:hypothetical protein